MQEFDVVIVGGGLVGAAVARAISTLSIKVAIIDQAPAAALYHSDLDNRGLAIAYSTKQTLNDLHIWDKLRSYAYPIEHVHVSQQGSFGFTKLSARTHHIPHLGYVISASVLGKSLLHDLEQMPNLTVMRPVTLNDAQFLPDHGWQLCLGDSKLRAKIVIAADGTNSLLRKIVGVGVSTKSFAQTAIVTNVHVEANNTTIAYERFTDLGVLALLPFGRGKMKCVWTIDDVKKQELLGLSDADFTKQIQLVLGYRAGKFLSVDERKAFPITTAYIDRNYAQQVFFLGNAANTLHPVAAQGFNLGVRDAITIANILRTQFDTTKNIALMGQAYMAARYIDQQRAQDFSNNLVEIFASEIQPIQSLRSLGLMCAEFMPKLKARIIARGLGVWT